MGYGLGTGDWGLRGCGVGLLVGLLGRVTNPAKAGSHVWENAQRAKRRSRRAGRLGRPVACVAARMTAVAMTSAASAPRVSRSGSPRLVPVAIANTASPSAIV